MKFYFFHLMPYGAIDPDFLETNKSSWINLPNRYYDPKAGAKLYHRYLDDIATSDVVRFERELLEFMRSRHSGMMSDIRTGGVPDELADAVQAFKDQFQGGDGSGYAVDPTSVDADEMGDAASAKTLATE